MERVFDVLRKVAPTKMNVLITGESGTGKELVANALHHNSPRRPRAFVALNCGAIPREIIESELFGHEKGAFTGALVKRMGRIEQAHGGTLFLDEVSEMPPDLQVKFLRVLEERRVTPVGGNDSKESDFRLVSATNRDLKKEIEVGRFRQDLYYRIKGVVVDLPPLRERREDLALLAERFREVFAREHDRPVTGFTPAALSALLSYPWPGNVREMKSAIEWGVFSAAGPRIDVVDLPPDVKGDARGRRRGRGASPGGLRIRAALGDPHRQDDGRDREGGHPHRSPGVGREPPQGGRAPRHRPADAPEEAQGVPGRDRGRRRRGRGRRRRAGVVSV